MPEDYSSEDLWPVHLKPKEDELLSSWLVRLARGHGLKLHTFCSLAWPKKQIWNRDIDKSSDSELVKVLSDRTGTLIERTRATTLGAYQGVLYEKHNRYGPSSWIMPVGVYHRVRRQFGLQFCPRCLTEDKEPYYRRRWRLAFIAVCERHNIQLHDRCPRCGEPVNFHRDELGDYRKPVATSLTRCHACRFELQRTEDKRTITVKPTEAEFASLLLQAMDTGFVRISKTVVTHTYLFFSGLRQLMKIVAMRDKRVDILLEVINKEFGIDTFSVQASQPHRDVQEMGVTTRRQLLGISRCLLEEWPERFVELSRRSALWSSIWLRHVAPPARAHTLPMPFWLSNVVYSHLYKAKYHPSNEEVKSAASYLIQTGQAVNKSTLARLLGISVLRREITLD